MAKIIPLRDPTNYRRVYERIKGLWNEGKVVIQPHAKDQMRRRRLHTPDVDYVIRTGRIVGHSRPHTWWRYVIDGRSVDGTRMRCVVEINGQLVLVTVIDRSQ